MGLIQTKNPKCVLGGRMHKGIGNHSGYLRFDDLTSSRRQLVRSDTPLIPGTEVAASLVIVEL